MRELSRNDDLLIVGLGNPGPDYAKSRHNLGWMCLDELGRRLGVEIERKRWRALVAATAVAGRRVWLVKPQTWMNLSGQAVATAARDLEVGAGDVWVVHDELDLPLCRLRIRVGGSGAGNNGVRSVIEHLGSPDFVRFRVGIGKPPSAAAGIRYVLAGFGKAEAERVPAVVAGVADALQFALAQGLKKAMDQYNQAGALGCEELG
jgi:PTH1 family peptidyl-tRNA hydrolase